MTTKNSKNLDLLQPLDDFARRHLGPRAADVQTMLKQIGVDSLDALIEQTVPDRKSVV